MVPVLLVDDQPFIGAAVKGLLTADPDLELTVCQDPRQAQELAARTRAAVVLIDLVMPDIDGMTLIRLMRADPATSHIPLIAMSGNDDEPSRQGAFAAGASDFLLKLPPALELIATIRRHAAAPSDTRRADAAEGAVPAAPAPPAPPAPADPEQTLDREALAAMRDMDPETGAAFIASLVDMFLSETGAQLEQLREAVARADGEAMRTLGHRLRGSANTIGALRLAALSGQLEDHAKRNRSAAVGRVLLAEIVKEFAQVQNALATELGRPEAGTQ